MAEPKAYEPEKLTSGVTWKWKKTVSDYPASEWTLTYYLRKDGATATSFSATADGEQAALLIQFSQADAGGFVFVVFQRLETWPSGLAAFLGVRAAGVEGAAAGWVERRRWISGKQDTFAGALTVGVGHRHRADKRLGVRVLRVVENFRRRAYLDDAAEVHHRDAIGDVFDDG